MEEGRQAVTRGGSEGEGKKIFFMGEILNAMLWGGHRGVGEAEGKSLMIWFFPLKLPRRQTGGL